MPTKQKEDTMNVTENADGSAMVEMPDDAPTGLDQRSLPSGDPTPHDTDDTDDDDGEGEGHDVDSDGERQSGEAHTDDAHARTPEEQEALRERRRQERADRKQRERDRWSNMQTQLAESRRVIEDLVTRQAQQERRSVGSDLAQLDTALATTDANIARLKGAISDGTTRSDGKLVSEATDRLADEKRRKEALSAARTALVRETQQRQNNQGGTQAPEHGNAPGRAQAGPDPQLVREAQAWMARNKWYNPAIKSQDDRITYALDQAVEQDGFDPRTPEYWIELDSRIAKVLPHRKGKGVNMGDTRGGERPGTRRVPVSGGSSQTAGSSGNGSRGGFQLSAERVKALKEAGQWEDPKLRAGAIREFQKYDREHTGQR